MANRIPEYLANVSMDKGGGVGQYNPTAAYYSAKEREAQINKLGSDIMAAHNLIQKQENNNVINQELNTMVDDFQRWGEESVQQKGANKVSHIENRAKSKLEQLRKTYSDNPYVLNSLEDAWRSKYSFYKANAEHEYRKEVVSEARGIVDEGNQKFLNGIFAIKDNQFEVYKRLDERLAAVDGLVQSGALKYADAVNIKQDLQNKTDVSRAQMALETNVRGALAMLQNPKEFQYLNGSQRSALINAAQSKIKQEEREAKAEARYQLMERRQHFNENVAVGAANAVEQYLKSGQKPKDYDQWRAAVVQNKDLPMAKRILNAMTEAEADMPLVAEARGMSVKELGQEITGLRTKEQAGQLTGDEQRQLRARERVLSEMMKASTNGDYLGYYASIGKPVMALTPETASQEVIENRKRWAGVAREQFGVDTDLLTAPEAKAFSDRFKSGDQQEKNRVAGVVASLSLVTGEDGKARLDSGRLLKILKLIGQDNPALVDELYLRVNGNKELADTMATGRALLQNNPEKLPSKEKIKTAAYSVLDELKLNIIDPNGEANKRYAAGIMEMYVGRYGDKTLDDVDAEDMKKVAKEYFGVRDFVKHKGETTIPVTPTQTQYEFDVMWNNLDADIFSKASGGKTPYVKMGTNLTSVSMEEIRKKGVLRPYGEGEYVVALPKANNMFSRGAEVILKDEHGQPIVLNMRKVLPDIENAVKSRAAQALNNEG